MAERSPFITFNLIISYCQFDKNYIPFLLHLSIKHDFIFSLDECSYNHAECKKNYSDSERIISERDKIKQMHIVSSSSSAL